MSIAKLHGGYQLNYSQSGVAKLSLKQHVQLILLCPSWRNTTIPCLTLRRLTKKACLGMLLPLLSSSPPLKWKKFLEKLQSPAMFGESISIYSSFLIMVVSFWIYSNMKNWIIELITNQQGIQFFDAPFSFPFIKIRNQDGSLSPSTPLTHPDQEQPWSNQCKTSWESTGYRRTLGHTQEPEGRGRTQAQELKMVKKSQVKDKTISKARLKVWDNLMGGAKVSLPRGLLKSDLRMM